MWAAYGTNKCSIGEWAHFNIDHPTQTTGNGQKSNSSNRRAQTRHIWTDGQTDLMFTTYEADLLCQNMAHITTKGRGVSVSLPLFTYTLKTLTRNA